MGEPLVVYHPRYLDRYPTAHVECPERVVAIYEWLSPLYDMVKPKPARKEDLLRVHTRRLIDSVREDPGLFEVASLAAGGAILTARNAVAGRPAFGLIRPPGHHASPDGHWGFCFFNNMAVALAALLDEGLIQGALVLDFDLHFGDGTVNYFTRDDRVTVSNLDRDTSRKAYLEQVREILDMAADIDVIGVSAGFDIGEMDWGGLLTTKDFEEIGRLVKNAAERLCHGRRFGLLEGGYYIPELGKNTAAFCRGLFSKDTAS